MDDQASASLSFIVKIWLEETAREAGQATWRGHVTHVPDGQRRYFQNLDDIALFIVPYLILRQVRLPIWWRVRSRMRRWLKAWRRKA